MVFAEHLPSHRQCSLVQRQRFVWTALPVVQLGDVIHRAQRVVMRIAMKRALVGQRARQETALPRPAVPCACSPIQGSSFTCRRSSARDSPDARDGALMRRSSKSTLSWCRPSRCSTLGQRCGATEIVASMLSASAHEPCEGLAKVSLGFNIQAEALVGFTNRRRQVGADARRSGAELVDPRSACDRAARAPSRRSRATRWGRIAGEQLLQECRNRSLLALACSLARSRSRVSLVGQHRHRLSQSRQ